MNITIFLAGVSLASTFALANSVCNLKKVVVGDNGKETVTDCKVVIDPKDTKGNPGSGGISHKKPVGTLSTNCPQYFADYDSKTKKIKPFMVYDQGTQSAEDTNGLFYMIKELGYLNHGDLGFDQTKVASVNWYSGGFGAILSNFYVAFDEKGEKLGMIFIGGMNPSMSFQGCFIN